MNKWVTLLAVYCLSAGCTSYKKAVTTHAVIDDTLERDKLILGRKEIDVDTSVWQNGKIVITDVEFYPMDAHRDLTGSKVEFYPIKVGALVADSNLGLYRYNDYREPLKPTSPMPAYAAVSPVKRIRHVVIESLKEEEARSKVSTAKGAIELSKVEIKEQEDIKEDMAPAVSSGSVYVFWIGAFAGLLVLLFLRKLF